MKVFVKSVRKVGHIRLHNLYGDSFIYEIRAILRFYTT